MSLSGASTVSTTSGSGSHGAKRSAFSVGLASRLGALKGVEASACLNNARDGGHAAQIAVEAAGVIHLGHQQHIGKSDLVAMAKTAGGRVIRQKRLDAT